jgi:hypothetical protein
MKTLTWYKSCYIRGSHGIDYDSASQAIASGYGAHITKHHLLGPTVFHFEATFNNLHYPSRRMPNLQLLSMNCIRFRVS